MLFRLIDESPVLNTELLSLGRWIADYYCAPLGEVLRSMLPLSAEIRAGKMYTLTAAGQVALARCQIGQSRGQMHASISSLGDLLLQQLHHRGCEHMHAEETEIMARSQAWNMAITLVEAGIEEGRSGSCDKL